MRDEDIHVGDVLRIRQWDDMAAEFGTFARTGIKLRILTPNYNFLRKMDYLCGQLFTVSGTCDNACYQSEENVEGRWKITAEMLDPAYIHEEVPEEPLPDIDLTDFLE